MKKKTFMAAILAGLLFFLLTIQVVEFSEAQPIGSETLGIVSAPAQPSSSSGYGTSINFLPQEGNADSSIVFSVGEDGRDVGTGLGVSMYFSTLGISVDNRSIYRVTESNRLNRTLQQLDSYNFSKWVVTNYHVTDLYNVTFFSLSAGQHQVTVYLGNGVGDGFYVYIYSSSSFVTNSQVTPTPTPSSSSTITASLAESASSLYLGSTINFTATAEGGMEPYVFAWCVDNQTVQVGSSPFYATDALVVGEHHVYVQVVDTQGTTATSLMVAFDVLPNPSSTPAPSPSPSVPEFPAWAALPLVLVAFAGVLVGVKRKRA